jgi:hypothetical protein
MYRLVRIGLEALVALALLGAVYWYCVVDGP